MNAVAKFDSQKHIKVRKGLDFRLDEMPTYWFGSDPFKTRFVEAISISFPEGERYFIESVRAYRDDITDDQLKASVASFIQQEAQHGIAHNAMNDLLKQQGLPIDSQEAEVKRVLTYLTKTRSKKFNIAYTAGCEHMTALIAKCFFDSQAPMKDAHPHMRALFAWHAIEEMEHRAVCFNVMRDVAKVNYPLRVVAMLMTAYGLFYYGIKRTDQLLAADGFSRLRRGIMMAKGINWLLGKEGVLLSIMRDYIDYARFDFHPDDHPVVHNYSTWLAHFNQDGDALHAGQKFWEAAHP